MLWPLLLLFLGVTTSLPLLAGSQPILTTRKSAASSSSGQQGHELVIPLTHNPEFANTVRVADLLRGTSLKFGLSLGGTGTGSGQAQAQQAQVGLLSGLDLAASLLSAPVTTLIQHSSLSSGRKSHRQRDGRAGGAAKEKRLLGGLLGLGIGRSASSTTSSSSSKGSSGGTTASTKLGLDLGVGNLLGADADTNVALSLMLANSDAIDDGWNTRTSRAINSNNDNAWFAKMSFGTPGQELIIDIDSGSADTIVFDKSCTTCQLSNHTPFDTSASSTYGATKWGFSTTYGDGTSLSGSIGLDSVNLTDALSVDRQVLALITKRSGSSSTSAWDGVMGIGPDQLSFIENNVTPLSNLVKGNKLAKPLVGIALEKASEANPQGGGEYRWGGVNAGYVAGEIVYAPVSSAYFWGVDMPGIFVNGGNTLTSSSDAKRAIIDTGTTLVYTSTSAANNTHGLLGGAVFNEQEGVWYVPCDTSRMPNVFVEVAGHKWGIPASDVAFRPSGRSDGLCLSGIQGGSESFTVLGDVFIKNHYLVLHYGDSKNYSLSVGIANRTDVPIIL